MAQEGHRICGTMLLYYAEEVYAVIPKEADRKLLMKYASGNRVWKQDQKRYERLRRIIIDKRREETVIRNKARIARGQEPSMLPGYDKPFTIKEK